MMKLSEIINYTETASAARGITDRELIHDLAVHVADIANKSGARGVKVTHPVPGEDLGMRQKIDDTWPAPESVT